MRPTIDEYDAIQKMLEAEFFGAAELLGAETETKPFDPGKKGKPAKGVDWVPLHGPTQKLIFNDRADVVGACSEKYTGKSVVFGDCVIAHCYEEHDALAVVMGNSHRALAEGFCHDLTSFLLPRWREGNRVPLYRREKGVLVPNENAGDLMDGGIGLDYTGWKADPNNKDLYIKIKNRFGGLSRIRVIAIPYADMVQARMTNLNASMFYLEEATRCNGEAYFLWPSLQLNRRHGIKGPQQFLFSCNPDDPDHWVHTWMYKTVVVGKNDPGRDWPKDPEVPGIRRDKDVSFYYLPYKENEHNVSAKNREQMKKNLRAKPILRARLYDSKWIAMPATDALFLGEFDETRHVRGDVEAKRGLTPIPGYPNVIGLDWGTRSVGVVFKQIIESEDGPFTINFDVLSYYQELHKTSRLAIAILEKMRYWNNWLRGERDDERAAWCWWFIAGDDATTNYNPETGSLQARDLEDHMRRAIEEDPERYRGIEPPHIIGCPRPKDSREKRVDIIAESLMENRSVTSAMAEAIVSMFKYLPQDPESKALPKKDNRWIHIHDAGSYPEYYRRFMLPDGYTNFDDGPPLKVV